MNGVSEWMTALETRHLSELTFQEVARSLRALSSTYVERRSGLRQGAALTGAGKRAAFALFYGPLHFLLVRHIVSSIAAARSVRAIVDLGCGTGAASAAWATCCEGAPSISGVDRHPWAVDEARFTYRAFGLRGRASIGDLTRTPLPARSAALAAFAINELPDERRDQMLERFLAHAKTGGRVLIVEPLAGFVAPWWQGWARAFEQAGGRSDQWRVAADLPPLVASLDRAAGLRHQELTARSLWL